MPSLKFPDSSNFTWFGPPEIEIWHFYDFFVFCPPPWIQTLTQALHIGLEPYQNFLFEISQHIQSLETSKVSAVASRLFELLPNFFLQICTDTWWTYAENFKKISWFLFELYLNDKKFVATIGPLLVIVADVYQEWAYCCNKFSHSAINQTRIKISSWNFQHMFIMCLCKFDKKKLAITQIACQPRPILAKTSDISSNCICWDISKRKKMVRF